MAADLARCDAELAVLRGGVPVRSFAYPCNEHHLGPNLATSYERLVHARSSYAFVSTPDGGLEVRGIDGGWQNCAAE